jgi:hypothetical protein
MPEWGTSGLGSDGPGLEYRRLGKRSFWSQKGYHKWYPKLNDYRSLIRLLAEARWRILKASLLPSAPFGDKML